MYNSVIKPIIEYGSGIWGHVSGSRINVLQNRAMHFYLGVHKCHQILLCLVIWGWLRSKLSRYNSESDFGTGWYQWKGTGCQKMGFRHMQTHDQYCINRILLFCS